MADRWGALGQESIGHGSKVRARNVQSMGHGDQVGVLPRIWHVFVGESPFARAVKQVGLDISAPRCTAMAERLLPQSTPSVGHGGKVGVLPRIWHVFIVRPPFAHGKTRHFCSLGGRILDSVAISGGKRAISSMTVTKTQRAAWCF